MKKGLSVLLIAAALFGFYGSAVNLNDILACKDYWEEAGEKSTADMNKLEDGLNQLKENEQAYLDGQEQLAEGEKTLADGEAQYAQGLKDYEAAPGKLKAGEKQLAQGEKDYKKLKTLISGLQEAKKHGVNTTKTHDTYWHDGFAHKATKADYSDAGLQQARQVITAQISGKADQMALIGSMVGDPNLISNINNKASYEQFDKNVKKLVKAFGAASANLKTFATLANSYAENEDLANAYAVLTSDAAADATAAKAADQIVKGVQATLEKQGMVLSEDEVKAILSDPTTAADYGLGDYATQYVALTKGGKSVVRAMARGSVSEAMKAAQAQLGDNLGLVKGLSTDLYSNLVTSMTTLLANSNDTTDADFAKAIQTLKGSLATLGATLNGLAGELDTNAKTLQSWDDGYKTLADGQATLGSTSEGIPYAFKNMITNSTIKPAIKKYDKGLMKVLKKYKGDRLKTEDMDAFDDDITYLSNKIIPRCLKVLDKVKADANKQLAAGRKQLAQGRADYAAAPGKLADAEKQLADGRQQLADGKTQLAQYEDGEQQVRDGLAQLVGTEPDLDLVGILDRLDGDGDFDNGDEHLDIDEGLNAVEVGRGYQADDGVLITNEIMGRAVGTGALLGAGALAVLAAILSFLKKNKGAGVAAILAAAAGAFGAFYGTNAGTYFSNIAGSTAGNAAWIGAGILGAVALVHAIVHFTAKTDA